MSDRVGRKPILLVSVLATVGSYVWLALAEALWELFASRAFAGLMAGWLVTSQALVSDVTEPENRARGLGMLGAAFGIGFRDRPDPWGDLRRYGRQSRLRFRA